MLPAGALASCSWPPHACQARQCPRANKVHGEQKARAAWQARGWQLRSAPAAAKGAEDKGAAGGAGRVQPPRIAHRVLRPPQGATQGC